MLWLLIVLIVILLLFGGFGYGNRARWGGYYTGGTGILGALVIIFLVLVLLGAIKI